MHILLLAEGDTERALAGYLKQFLDRRAEAAQRPKVALRTKTLTLSAANLRGRIRLELRDPEALAVVALVDVYPRFASAQDAKAFLLDAAGRDPRFYAHVALHDVEAWLLPFWDHICARLRIKDRAGPGTHPEDVDLQRPPSKRLEELYRLAKPAQKYIKPIEMSVILKGKDLMIVAQQCPEFRALLNTLLHLSGLDYV
jgi:hypothetical protein